MAEEPSLKAISEVQEFTSFFDHATIGRALKRNNNDTMQVVQEYFEDPEQFKTKYSWDDTAFGADLEGNTQQGVSFHIESAPQGANTFDGGATGPSSNEPYYDRLALSRPPSRTGSHSPMDRVAEWRTDTTAVSQEDEDLQKALRLSAQESGVEVDPQEMGIINSVSSQMLQANDNLDASAPPPVVFGPARREDYPETNWAMVPSNSQQQTYSSRIGDIKPQQRRRPYDAPATLVLIDNQGRISKQDRLGGILSVLHSIPLARNILLGGSQNSTYGHHQDWWKGTPIYGISPETKSQALNADSEAMDWAVNQPTILFNDEIHRLISMLDMSERSFGTINALAEAMGGTYSLEQRFFEHIIGRDRETALPLITTVRRELMGPGAQADDSDDEEDNKTEVIFIDADINAENWPHVKSFTDIWDNIMWRDTVALNKSPEVSSQMMTIETQGDILVMQINTSNMVDVIDVPRQFSVERYMQDRKEEATGIVQMLTDQKLCLIQAEENLKKISFVRDSASGTDKPALSEYMAKISDYQNQRRYLEERARFRAFSDSGFDEKKYARGAEDAPADLNEQEQRLVAKLDGLIVSLQEKHALASSEIKNLEKHVAFHKEKLRHLSTMFSDPEKPRPKPFISRLMQLRGIVCENGITYICQRQEQKLIDLGDDDSAQPIDQWWRLSLSAHNEPAVNAKKVKWEDFSETFFHEGYNPVLIYATEDALKATPLPLTDALTKFIRFDNRLFHQELSRSFGDDVSGLANPGSGDTMIHSSPMCSPPGKRKHRSGSIGSMASNRASINSDRSNIDAPLPGTSSNPYTHQGSTSADAAMAWAASSAGLSGHQDLNGIDPVLSFSGDVKMDPPPYSASTTTEKPAFTQRETVLDHFTVHEVEVHSDDDGTDRVMSMESSLPLENQGADQEMTQVGGVAGLVFARQTGDVDDAPPPLPDRKPHA